MKICSKTGAVVYLEQYGAWAISDLFESESTAIFRITAVDYASNQWGRVHATVHDFDQWFDKGQEVSTLVTSNYTTHNPALAA